MLNHEKNIKEKKVTHPEADKALMKVLIGPDDGWEDHVLRTFELEPTGYTPKHTHDWPHINYVLKGEGTLFLNGKENQISEGSIAYVPSNTLHQFKNTGNKPLRFICIVPIKGHQL